MIAAASAVDLPLAFGAGVLTIAAPCILPMLPLWLGVSLQQGSKWRPVFIVAGFVGSFAACAFLFRALSDAAGLSQETVRNGAILMLAIFGVLMVWPQPFETLMMRMNGVINRIGGIGSSARPGNLGGLVLGMSMGAVWTPCAGPVLGAILALVAAANSPARSLLLLCAYAVGAGIPMLLIAYGGQRVASWARRLAKRAGRLQQACGVLIVLTAAAMYLQYDTLAVVWLSTFV